MAVAISSEFLRNDFLIGKQEIYCLEQNGFRLERGFIFFLRNDFEFINEFNKFIVNAGQGGLIKKWLHSMDRRTYFSDEQIFERRVTMEQLSILVLLWFLLILFTMFVFYAEKIIHKQIKRRNANGFWIFAEMMIDPDRHFFLNDLRF